MNCFLPVEENFLALPGNLCDPSAARVVVQQVPFEATTTFGKGCDTGPRAIVGASHEVELFDAELGFEPWKVAGGVATRPPIEVTGSDGMPLDGGALAERLRRETRRWIDDGRFVVTLGGEHTSVIGAIHAHCEAYEDVSVLQFDAHSDLRPEYMDSPWNHACAMSRVLDFHSSIVQVGIRSQDAGERALSHRLALPVFYAHAIHQQTEECRDWTGAVVAALKPRVYITFDCDAFDPAVIPATGTPEPGGLTWRQVNAVLARVCREREVVGFDINELAPIEGLSHPQFTIAKLAARLIGWRKYGLRP